MYFCKKKDNNKAFKPKKKDSIYKALIDDFRY